MTTRTIKAYEHHCQRCRHTWQSFLKDPVVCQSCKSRHWRTKAGPRGRPRTITDLTRYNREAKRRSRAKQNPKPEPEVVYVTDE